MLRIYMGGLAVAVLLSAGACTVDEAFPPDDTSLPEVPPYAPTPYTFLKPKGFPVPEIPGDNPLTEEGVQLGRRLYHDPLLSLNGPNQGKSCSSCHLQSRGFSNNLWGTSVLPHVNLGWSGAFLWNGMVEGQLEDIMRFEVEDFFQVDTDVLRKDTVYPEMFRKAFATPGITTQRVAYALAQFFRIQVSANAKFDKVYRNEAFFTDEELNGYDIFFSEKGDCFHCHGTLLFTDHLFHNNALDATPGKGRMEITGNPADRGKYKTPTLRNVELTGPYMHDGRFETLEEVVDFYSEGLQYSSTVDPLMKNIHTGGVALTQEEKKDLIVFLKALTDTTFTTDPKLKSPF